MSGKSTHTTNGRSGPVPTDIPCFAGTANAVSDRPEKEKAVHTTELNPVQKNIQAANDLMKLRGRAIGVSVSGAGCYCPLGAITAVCRGVYGRELLQEDIYVDTPEVAAVAEAVFEWWLTKALGRESYSLERFYLSQKSAWLHAYNDETLDDSVVFAWMDRAVEIAGETTAPRSTPTRRLSEIDSYKATIRDLRKMVDDAQSSSGQAKLELEDRNVKIVELYAALEKLRASVWAEQDRLIATIKRVREAIAKP